MNYVRLVFSILLVYAVDLCGNSSSAVREVLDFVPSTARGSTTVLQKQKSPGQEILNTVSYSQPTNIITDIAVVSMISDVKTMQLDITKL